MGGTGWTGVDGDYDISSVCLGAFPNRGTVVSAVILCHSLGKSVKIRDQISARPGTWTRTLILFNFIMCGASTHSVKVRVGIPAVTRLALRQQRRKTNLPCSGVGGWVPFQSCRTEQNSSRVSAPSGHQGIFRYFALCPSSCADDWVLQGRCI